MNSPSMDEFTRFRFLSGLQAAPEGEHAIFRVTRIEENEYRHTLWLWKGEQELRSMAELGTSSLFVWDSSKTLLFAALRNPKDLARKKKGEVLTVFYRLPVDGGEAVEAFRLPLEVEQIRPLVKDTYLVLARWKKDVPQGLEEGDCQILEEVPFWQNGKGFSSGRRLRLYLYHALEDRLEPVSKEKEDVEDFRVGPKGRFAYTVNVCPKVGTQFQSLWEYCPQNKASHMRLDAQMAIHEFDFWGEKLVIAGADGSRYGLLENDTLYLLEKEKLTTLARPDLKVGARINSDCRYGSGTTFQVAGDSLYFTAVQGYCCHLFEMKLPGGKVRPVTPAGYQVELFDAARDKLALVAFRGQELQELYCLEQEQLCRVSDFNTDALKGVWVGTPEHQASQRGGCPIDGWVIPPKDYRPEKTYPAILNIHGGPKTAYGDNYFHEMQFWAGQGYFVLFCNPRGSDGKGDAFSDIRGKYGTCDCDDVMGFLDEMLQRYPAIDPKRIGVAGGSYGGFLVNWMIGHTHRFAAAVSQRGIANWITMDLLSDIGARFVRDQIGLGPWKDWSRYWDRSPLKYADQVKTPTLFIHSDEDYRCPVGEGYQMYSALRQHGVECRACIFHGENHELSRSGKPAQRLRRLKEITAWMNRFCRG